MAKFSEHDFDEIERIEKDHERRGIFAFFGVFFGKFMKMLNLNLLYLLFSLPYIILLFILSPLNLTNLSMIVPGIAEIVASLGDSAAILETILRALFVMLILLLWGSGPATAGIAYIFRNFSRHEHAWIWTDNIATMKANFKQSMIVVLVDAVVIFLSTIAIRFYNLGYVAPQMQTVSLCVLGFFLLVYTFMHFYLYQFMVTYEDGILQHYRNAMMFALMKWLPNLLIFVFVAGVTIALFYFIQLFAIIPFILLFTSMLTLVIHFYTSRCIARTLEDAESKQDNA